MKLASWLHPILAVALAPLLPVLIQRVKALFAGRCGPPWGQGYRDLWKLPRKGGTYSRTTTWVFRAGPIVQFACLLVALLVVPAGGLSAPVAFDGDWILLAYMLGLGRFSRCRRRWIPDRVSRAWERAARCSLRSLPSRRC